MKNECFDCGRDTILDNYWLRVTNTSGNTLALTQCIVEAIKFMENGGIASLTGYRIEVIKAGKI